VQQTDRSDFEGFSVARREGENNNNNRQIHTLGFHFWSQKYIEG
jgi:hypothetical protein